MRKLDKNINNCIICGVSFRRSGIKNKKLCCSMECMVAHKKETYPSAVLEENKKECIICRKEYFIRGERRKLNSKTCSSECYGIYRSNFFRGENHPRWTNYYDAVGYLRHTPEYDNWRRNVYQKDGYSCKMCGATKLELVAHHEKNFKDYPELRFEVSNGITLCRSCHKKVHKEIGLSTRFKFA